MKTARNPLPGFVRSQLRNVVTANGLGRTALAMGVHRVTLAALLDGASANPATVDVVTSRLFPGHGVGR